jgi:hypothetical protein
MLLLGQLEHEVGREPVEVAANLLVQAARRDTVEHSQVGAEHDPVSVQRQDATLYHVADRHG